MQRKRLLIFLFLIPFLSVVSAPAYSAPFTNGGFENPPWSGNYQTLGSGSTSITGWTVDFGSVDLINTYWQNAEGQHSIDLSGDSLGSISQTFDTTIKQLYKVTFAMAGNPEGGPGIDKIKDLLAVIVGGAYSGFFSFDTTGKATTNMGWLDHSFLFTALTNSATIQFTSLEGNAFGAALDNVRIEAVPIPAAVYLLGTGLVGLVVLRRKFN